MMTKSVSKVRVEKIFSPGLHIVADLGQAGAQVLDELHQVLHGLDDFGNGEIVKNLFAVATQFSNLKKKETT
jgi:hypothetical protein